MIYSMMFPRASDDDSPGPATGQTALLPLAEGPCPSCTAFLDQLDGAAEHASQPINLAVAAKAPIERILTFAAERGWRRRACCHRPGPPITTTTWPRPPKASSSQC